MAIQLNRETIGKVKNPVFRACTAQYLDVYDDFVRQVEQFGLPFGPDREEEIAAGRISAEGRWSGAGDSTGIKMSL